MNKRVLMGMGILAGTMLLGDGISSAGNDPAYQEKLEKEQKQIDAAVLQAGGTIAKKLADKFGLKPDEIQKIRDGGPMAQFEGRPGWGEITILLSMARQLAKTHPADYPTFNKALEKIQSLRNGNVTYESIADRLEFNLQPVLVEAQQVCKSLQPAKNSR